MAGFDASEIYTLANDLKVSGAKAKKTAGAVIRKTAADIAADAINLSPVDTGNLKSSIGVKKVGALEAEIGPTAEYGIYLELGTSRMPAQPFMGPATDRRIPGFVQAMGQIADGII